MITFSGIIVHGEKIARRLGYPTANIDILHHELLEEGVYAAKAIIEETLYPGALVVTKSPLKVEIHLLGVKDIDLYGKQVHVALIERVSDIERFVDEDSLKKKIEEDIAKVKKVLKSKI